MALFPTVPEACGSASLTAPSTPFAGASETTSLTAPSTPFAGASETISLTAPPTPFAEVVACVDDDAVSPVLVCDRPTSLAVSVRWDAEAERLATANIEIKRHCYWSLIYFTFCNIYREKEREGGERGER